MKKIKFLATLLAAGALVACNETIEPQGSGENTPTTGEGYVKVAINMPTTSGDMTKANDDFDNGTADEYKVGQNNWIVFFNQQGTTENNATVVNARLLDELNLGSVNDDPANITTRTTAIIDKIPTNATHALVILNSNNLIAYSDELTVNNEEVKSFADLTTELSNQNLTAWIGTEKNSFLMTNAPIASLSGNDSQLTTGQSVTTLAKITVYPDEESAQTANPDQIYVERAVAKVTIAAFPENIDLDGVDDDNPLNKAKVELTGWALDNTNTSVKLVRDVTGSSDSPEWTNWMSITNTVSPENTTNRFFGTAANPYRVYWAIDGNYSNADNTVIHDFGTASDDTWHTSIGSTTNPVADYCFENTFPMSDNTAGNTVSEAVATRVLFRMNVTPNIQEDGSTVGEGDTPATDFILFGGTSAVYTKTTFENYVKEYVLPNEENVKVNSSLTEGAIFDTSSDLYGDDGLFSSGVDENNAVIVLDALGGEVRYYKNNVMYTDAAYIKHFGETYTPIVEAGLTDHQSYLGRYGVVRNNWYELNVTKVGIGSPVIPDEPGNLDEEEAYMNVQINILSWAKRSQDVDL